MPISHGIKLNIIRMERVPFRFTEDEVPFCIYCAVVFLIFLINLFLSVSLLACYVCNIRDCDDPYSRKTHVPKDLQSVFCFKMVTQLFPEGNIYFSYTLGAETRHWSWANQLQN